VSLNGPDNQLLQEDMEKSLTDVIEELTSLLANITWTDMDTSDDNDLRGHWLCSSSAVTDLLVIRLEDSGSVLEG